MLLCIGVLAIVACSKTVDGTDLISYKASITAMKEDLTVEEKDSLSKSISRIITDKGYGLLNIKQITIDLDGKSVNDIFKQGDVIYKEELLKLSLLNEKRDSLREVEKNDSIENYAKNGLWELHYFVDEFKEKTKNGYLSQKCQGQFSNSATEDSKLNVQVIYSKNSLQFFFYEYGNSLLKSFKGARGEQYQVKIKEVDKEGIIYNEWAYFITDRMYIDDSVVVQSFQEGKKLKFLVRNPSKYSSSTYLFNVDASNLDKAMQAFDN